MNYFNLVMPGMELKNHSNSDKVFVWSTYADLSDPDEPPKPETLAIRFGSVESNSFVVYKFLYWLNYF